MENDFDRVIDKKIKRRLKKARKLKEEDDEGNIEYKWKLCNFRYNDRTDRLTSQLRYRLVEGEGVAIYNLGYSDDGEPEGIIYDYMLESLKNLHTICEEIGAILKTFRVFQGVAGYCANVYITKDDVEDWILDHDDLNM